jgi:hypothetical protein
MIVVQELAACAERSSTMLQVARAVRREFFDINKFLIELDRQRKGNMSDGSSIFVWIPL